MTYSAYTNTSVSSGVNVGCCFYPPKILVGNFGNNIDGNGNFQLLSSNYYGQSDNINFGCNIPCPPNLLISSGGSTKNLVGVGNVMCRKLVNGNQIGNLGSVVVSNPSKNIVL